MRSRYCAFVKKDADYLVKTWHPTCQADVYEYVIQLRDIKDRRHKFIGHVTLVR